jgi:hypothetical protein
LTAERAARALVEAEAAGLRAELAAVRAGAEREREAHRAQVKDILDRFVPNRMTAAAAGADASAPVRFTAADAARVPAAGKGDMQRRRAEVRRLEAEEAAEDKASTRKGREAVLADDEERATHGLSPRAAMVVDTLLGIRKDAFPIPEKPAAQTEAA